ncbi:MAG TPA: zinc metalloprotease HtpX [Microthrixaceae bacterium]|nr:zinc metalloprotease HtpX [Microthrixaceae bacterium]
MKNNLKTAALLAGLGGLCLAIGSFWGPQGLWIGLFIGLAFVGGSYWFSDKLAIGAARAQEVDESTAPEYIAMVRDLAQRSDIPMPRCYVAPSPQPNAFATGRSPSHAAVCINSGLTDFLTWDEIQGVLAHEISHVRNRDILTSSVAAAIAMGITFIARMAMWGAIFGGGRSDDRDGGSAIGALLMVVLAPIAAMLIQMAISRSREFEADASAARLLGNGEPLARALEKLEIGTERIPVEVNPAQAQAYIAEPLRGKGIASMFSTHPPMADRVARLRAGEWR